MKIILSIIVLSALFALVGCTAPRSGAGKGGTPDRYSQGSGFESSAEETMAEPEGDYRDILSDPGPF
jgi:hypothetical protein